MGSTCIKSIEVQNSQKNKKNSCPPSSTNYKTHSYQSLVDCDCNDENQSYNSINQVTHQVSKPRRYSSEIPRTFGGRQHGERSRSLRDIQNLIPNYNNMKEKKTWKINVEASAMTGLRVSSPAIDSSRVATKLKQDSKRRNVFSVFGDQGMYLDYSSAEKKNEIRSSGTIDSMTLQSEFNLSSLDIHKEKPSCILQTPVDQTVSPLGICYGSYSAMGIRPKNEDRYSCITCPESLDSLACFGVYDGHGGSQVAEYLSKNLHENVFDFLKKGYSLEKSIEYGFAMTDELIYQNEVQAGSTAIFAIIKENQIVLASVGDSQAVLCSGGVARNMCVVHKPSLKSEQERIIKANGKVVNGRLFGVLGVSRAFGDNDLKTSRGQFSQKFKGDLVSAVPDIVKKHRSEDDEFIVLGCDGIFDVLTPSQVVRHLRQSLSEKKNAQSACEDLVSHVLKLGSTDNVSVILISLNQYPFRNERMVK